MTTHEHLRLPAYVRRARQRRQISQSELAQKCEVSRSYVCSIEAGRVAGPAVDLMGKLIEAMTVTPREAETLHRLAAQDRVMRVAVAELPSRAQRLLAACLEVERLLPDRDVEAWVELLEKTVQERLDFIVRVMRDEETAMT